MIFHVFLEHDIKAMKAKVLAVALGVQTNYPLPTPDACQGLINAECPLDKGEEVTYQFEMPILQSFPKVVPFFFVYHKSFTYTY